MNNYRTRSWRSLTRRGKFTNSNLNNASTYRKQMKSFSIRKATNPNQLRDSQGQEVMADSMKYDYATGEGVTGSPTRGDKPKQPTLLSQEEQE
jgi:hypothetical protein